MIKQVEKSLQNLLIAYQSAIQVIANNQNRNNSQQLVANYQQVIKCIENLQNDASITNQDEQKIVEQHQKAVKKYRELVINADIWNKHLYTFINNNLQGQ